MSQSYPQAFVSFTPRKGPQSIHAGVEIMKIECPNIHSGASEGVGLFTVTKSPIR